MIYQSTTLLAALLATSAFVSNASASETAEEQYVPGNIVVTGTRGGYGEDDGSTATKTPTPLIDVPQAVTVLTRDQLDDQNVRQLAESLRYVPGVSIETGEGHRDTVFIRGQATSADFYLDGLRDDAQYYRALYNVERVEVLKGANALIFGRGGGGGVINRVSKRADPTRRLIAGNADIDSFGGWSVAGDVNAALSPGAALRLNATYEKFANSRDFYDGNFIGISPTATVLAGPDTRITATYSYDRDARVTDRGVPSLDGEPLRGYDRTFFGDRDFNRSRANVHIARLRVDHDLADGLSLNATGQFANYGKYYGNVTPAGATGTTATLAGYESATDRRNWIGQANLVWEASLNDGVASTLLAGIEAGDQHTTSTRADYQFLTDNGYVARVTVPLERVLAIPAGRVTPLTRSSTSDLTTLSAYAQEQLDLGIFQLVAGLRYDRFDLAARDRLGGTATKRRDEAVSPRFGAILKPRPNLSVYASYTTSFLPQSGDQFSSLGAIDAALEPEKFENVEAGVKFAPAPDLFLTAAIFRLTRSNTTAADPANPGFVVLTGSSRTQGVELSLAGKLAPGLQATLGYTYLDGKITADTENADAGQRLNQVPRHQISAWARYDITPRLGLGAGVIHQADQFATIANDVVLPAYTRIDAAAFFDLTPRVALQLNVENLLNADYYPSAHGSNNIQPGEPLGATFGVRVKL